MKDEAIEFWFDFSSSYAYFAMFEIEAIAEKHDRSVLWRPFMLGTAFEVTGAGRLSHTPLKGDYARHDWKRIARLTGRTHILAPHHPSVALAATRAFYHVERTRPEKAVPFAKAIFEAYFTQGIDTANPKDVGRVAASLGLAAEEIARADADPEMKRHAREMSESAVARGIFGAPWFVVDGEPFWGWDRLPMLDDWLERGGW